MSVAFRETRSSGGAVGAGLVDAAGGLAAIVLAICGLSGVHPPMLAAVAVAVLGVELLARGGMIVAALSATETGADLALAGEGGGGIAALFLAGLGGVVLGVLAILGVAPLVLAASAAIGFGVSLVLSLGAGAVAPEPFGEASSAAGGAPAIAGLVAIVLGVLALAQPDRAPSLSLVLVALLVVGAALVVSGGGARLLAHGLMRRNL